MNLQLLLGLPVALAVALTAAELSPGTITPPPAPPRTAASAPAGHPLAVAAPATRPSAAPATRPSSGAAPLGPALRGVARRALVLTAGLPRLGYRVRFAGPRPGERARIDRERRLIEVFVRPDDPAHRVAHDLAHELGHAYDDRRLTVAGRARFLRARGAPGAPWWPRGARSDLATGAGDFAEVFARCHVPSPDFRSALRPAPADPCAILPPTARPR